MTPEEKKKWEDHIKYLQKNLDERIKLREYYESEEIGIDHKKHFPWLEESIAESEQKIREIRDLVDGKVPDRTTPKVRVTAHKGHTLDQDENDKDFSKPGAGFIGCTLRNVSRLEMSSDARVVLETMKHTGDDLGAVSCEKDSFGWVGPMNIIYSSDETRGNSFNMPRGYVEIENDPPEWGVEEVEKSISGGNVLDYRDIEFEIWLNFYQHRKWNSEENDPDDFTMEFQVHTHYVYDAGVEIIKAPNGTIRNYEIHYEGDGGRSVHLEEMAQEALVDYAKYVAFALMKDRHVDRRSAEFGKALRREEMLPLIKRLLEAGCGGQGSGDQWRIIATGNYKRLREIFKNFYGEGDSDEALMENLDQVLKNTKELLRKL